MTRADRHRHSSRQSVRTDVDLAQRRLLQVLGRIAREPHALGFLAQTFEEAAQAALLASDGPMTASAAEVFGAMADLIRAVDTDTEEARRG